MIEIFDLEKRASLKCVNAPADLKPEMERFLAKHLPVTGQAAD